jgi:hypothetical protein
MAAKRNWQVMPSPWSFRRSWTACAAPDLVCDNTFPPCRSNPSVGLATSQEPILIVSNYEQCRRGYARLGRVHTPDCESGQAFSPVARRTDV